MNVVLWIIQGLLAAAFLAAGVMKTTQPKEKLAANMGWVEDYSAGMVRFIGATEIAAAVGLILPAVTGIATFLTPLAALGLVIVMVLAIRTHLARKENNVIGANIVLLVLAAIVVWGRFGPYAF